MKKLIYILAKWMFVNRWTGDRIFRANEEERQNREVGMEREVGGNVGKVGKDEGNVMWKIEEGFDGMIR